VAVSEFAYSYGSPSVLRDRRGGQELLLSTSGGVTEAGPAAEPFFFSGFLADPAVAARGMLACAAVARSRYIRDAEATAAMRDPVVTSNQDRLRFEAFSSCCGVHARLDLLPAALAEAPAASGTTNVDFNEAMRAALAGAAVRGPLLLSVGRDEVSVDTAGGSVTERRVPLPDRWLKGFGELQALAQRMRLAGELSGTAAQRFVRSLPRTTRQPLWAVPAGGSMSLTVAARPGAVCVAGPHRLAELGPLLRLARRLRVYGPEVVPGSPPVPSGWELDLGSARFTLTVSPEPYRGFSGEGALLGLLADEDAAADAQLAAGELGWGPQIDAAAVAEAVGLDLQRMMAALGYLAASGQVGYDLAEAAFFRRELPFGRAVEAMHPRLASARDLVDSGAVALGPAGALVRSGDIEQKVTFAQAADLCTCPWWAKHQGRRGPCKHVLAARMAAAAASHPPPASRNRQAGR
jgi:SWIM zinc finger